MSTHCPSSPHSTASNSTRSTAHSNHSAFRRIFPSKQVRKKFLRKQRSPDAHPLDSDSFAAMHRSDTDLSDASVSTLGTLGPASKDASAVLTQQMPAVSLGDSHDMGDIMTIGDDTPPGKRVNDGYVSLIVPSRWVACRKEGCVYFFSGLSVGYVRTVRGTQAAKALLETDRLQLVDHVDALSSPVWEGEVGGCMKVEYSSQLGAGAGLAIFGDKTRAGACVMAMCGPWRDSAFIFQSLQQLRRSVRLIKLYSGSDVAIPIDDVKDHDSQVHGAVPQRGETQARDATCSVQ
eukprot:GFKZ01003371.1.p1 GENE.GFKZ01003371.1~~GFKZ01003371.1.p1  ORF type:complete len:307 (+),score=35.38 GFKZ01003371.1:51-923(+)